MAHLTKENREVECLTMSTGTVEAMRTGGARCSVARALQYEIPEIGFGFVARASLGYSGDHRCAGCRREHRHRCRGGHGGLQKSWYRGKERQIAGI